MSDLEMNGNLIQFKGELNEELVKDLKDLILAKQDFPEEVILDLTELDGIGVMGIQTILAVRENLMMVPGQQAGESLWNTWFARGKIAREEQELCNRADDVLKFLTIDHLAGEKAGNLSGGQKKLLELGRTMMVEAKIVFLDEVGAGVNRTLLNTIADAIVRLNKERGYTFCVIEHDMDFIARLCDPVIVMAEGHVLAEGTIEEIKNNEQVIEAYLGTGLKNRPKAGTAS